MATENEITKKARDVKAYHAQYKIAQSESNTALARWKKSQNELEEML
jgi:hypothetical protein